MKLKKKEGQSVDTLLLLRRQNKRSQPVHMSQALQSRGSNPQSSGSRLLVSTVGLVMPSAASGWSPSRAGGQLHAQRLAGRRQPVYLVPALQSRWSSPEASDRCLPISPQTRSTLSHWSWCRRSAIHPATCEGETASTTCIQSRSGPQRSSVWGQLFGLWEGVFCHLGSQTTERSEN